MDDANDDAVVVDADAPAKLVFCDCDDATPIINADDGTIRRGHVMDAGMYVRLVNEGHITPEQQAGSMTLLPP